jgi:hypothetical protein
VAVIAAAIGLASVAGGQNGSLLIADASPSVDYHAEGQLIGGNINIHSDRAPSQGSALTDGSDPDPRSAPNIRPTAGWATPAGSGRDRTNLSAHIGRPDTDISPNGSFTPQTNDDRESMNGQAGFIDHDSTSLEMKGHFFDDEDMQFRLTPRTIDAYLAPNGNANNRWRRICGTGVVEDDNGNRLARSPFLAGQVRKFVLQIWDADWRDPSDNDGGNQDYYIIDILAPDSGFNTSRCDRADAPPPVLPNNPANPQQQQQAGQAPAAAAPRRESVASRRLRGAARLAGPSGCQSKAFTASVTGQNIAQVVFSVDGRRVRTRLKPDAKGRWAARITPSNYRAGRHRVEAGVSFVTDATPRTKRVRLSFQRCLKAQRRVAPQFTG